jgi:hypothetical protein
MAVDCVVAVMYAVATRFGTPWTHPARGTFMPPLPASSGNPMPGRPFGGAVEITAVAGVLGTAIIYHAPDAVTYALTATLAFLVWRLGKDPPAP